MTAGTLFRLTHKPLRLWFRAITLWVTSKRALSAKELAVARTDGLATYNDLHRVGIGHQRHVIGSDPEAAVKVLPHIRKVFSLLKRLLLGTFHGSVSHKHLWAYHDEFESASTAGTPQAAGSSSSAS